MALLFNDDLTTTSKKQGTTPSLLDNVLGADNTQTSTKSLVLSDYLTEKGVARDQWGAVGDALKKFIDEAGGKVGYGDIESFLSNKATELNVMDKYLGDIAAAPGQKQTLLS